MAIWWSEAGRKRQIWSWWSCHSQVRAGWGHRGSVKAGDFQPSLHSSLPYKGCKHKRQRPGPYKSTPAFFVLCAVPHCILGQAAWRVTLEVSFIFWMGNVHMEKGPEHQSWQPAGWGCRPLATVFWFNCSLAQTLDLWPCPLSSLDPVFCAHCFASTWHSQWDGSGEVSQAHVPGDVATPECEALSSSLLLLFLVQRKRPKIIQAAMISETQRKNQQ